MFIIGGNIEKGAYQEEVLCLTASFPKNASPSVSWSNVEHTQPVLTGMVFLLNFGHDCVLPAAMAQGLHEA